MDRATLLNEHRRITGALTDHYERLAMLLPDERKLKCNAFLAAEGSDRVRSETAQQAALHLTEQILSSQRMIDSLTAEIEDVRLQLHYS